MSNHNINDVNSPLATKGDVEKVAKDTHVLLTAIVIVLFIGFITIFVTCAGFIIDAWRFRGDTYQNLVNQVTTQNTKIDNLTNQLNSLKHR